MSMVRCFAPADFPAIQAIYQQGIDTRNATFENSVKDWPQWDSSLLPHCRLVFEKAGKVLGWTALSPASSRCVYRGVAEVSIYVAKQARGGGIGQQLLSQLVVCSEKQGIWTLQAGIFPENTVSMALFRNNGFRILGEQRAIGQMDGKWRDVVLLERRSTVAGI